MKTMKVSFLAAVLLLSCPGIRGQASFRGQNIPVSTTVNTTVYDGECDAAFNAIPDSLSSFPYLYHFTDISTGTINNRSWDFGDGSASTEQNPSHQYESAGTYHVCLTISGTYGTGTCSDQFCLDITTLDYYSLGGLAYAGEYPLNNPVNVGDTGVASLYRIINSQAVFVEDHLFQEYGYFWFGYLFEGDYMIKIGLTQGSPNYRNYFTTYFGDEITWGKSDIVNVSSTNQFEAEIHLTPVKEVAPGPGIIRGYVKFEQGTLYSMPPISQTNVILYDKYYTPLEFTHPDASGYFEFQEIPYASYYLSADATGKTASTVLVTLSSGNPVVEGINLTVFGSNVNYITDQNKDAHFLVKIFPNPVRENLHLSYYSDISAHTGFSVLDITGKELLNAVKVCNQGWNEITLPVNDLPPGIYLLRISPNDSYQGINTRFVK